MDERRDPNEERARFNKAIEVRDFATMWDVLYHTACQYCKKKQGYIWDTDRIHEGATEIAMILIERIRRKPDYRCNHMAAVHYAFLRVAFDIFKKKDFEDKHADIDEIRQLNQEVI